MFNWNFKLNQKHQINPQSHINACEVVTLTLRKQIKYKREREREIHLSNIKFFTSLKESECEVVKLHHILASINCIFKVMHASKLQFKMQFILANITHACMFII